MCIAFEYFTLILFYYLFVSEIIFHSYGTNYWSIKKKKKNDYAKLSISQIR